MMRKLVTIVVWALLLPVLPAVAQNDTVSVMDVLDSLALVERQDSMRKAQQALQKQLQRSTQRDISGYAMQKRYRPSDQKTGFGRVVSNSFVWLNGSFYCPIGPNYSYGPLVSAGLGKWFTSDGLHRYHGLKIGGGLGYFFDDYNASHVKTVNATASYMFDVSSFVKGYDPDRFVSFAPLVGAGFHFTEGAVGRIFDQASISLHTGVDVAFHVLPGIDFVLEPLFLVQTDPRKLQRENIWRSFVPVFSGNMGLTVSLDRNYWLLDPGKDWRISLGGGVSLLNTYLLSSIKDVPRLMGPSYHFGLGRSFTDLFGWRVQLAYAKSFWDTDDGTAAGKLLSSQYYQVHMDGMFELLPWLNLFVGPEAGFLTKERTNLGLRPYVGVSAGMRLGVPFLKHFFAYAEGRYSVIPYAYLSHAQELTYKNYMDGVANLSLGLEFRFASKRRNQDGHRQPARFAVSDWYTYASGSYYRPQLFSGASGVGPLVNAGAGFWFKERNAQFHGFHGVKGNASLGFSMDNLTGCKNKTLGLQLSYVYDLSGRIWGPGKHLYEMQPYAGVNYLWFWQQRPRSIKAWESTFGLHAGVSFSAPLYSGMDFILEPQLEVGPVPKPGSSALPWQVAGLVNMGVRFNLGQGKWSPEPDGDWRVGASFTMNPGLALHFIRKYADWMDWRVTGGVQWPAFTSFKEVSRKSVDFYGRLDAMVDLVYLLGGRQERKLSVSPFLGPEVDILVGNKTGQLLPVMMGLGGGAQVKYKLHPRIAIFAEGRASALARSVYFTQSKTYSTVISGIYNMSIGLEYAL